MVRRSHLLANIADVQANRRIGCSLFLHIAPNEALMTCVTINDMGCPQTEAGKLNRNLRLFINFTAVQ